MNSYIVRGPMRPGGLVGTELVLTDDGTTERSVGVVDNADLATYLAEAHNGYVAAFRRLVAVVHPDAIPAAWYRDDRVMPVTLGELVDVLTRHLPANSVGGPA